MSKLLLYFAECNRLYVDLPLASCGYCAIKSAPGSSCLLGEATVIELKVLFFAIAPFALLLPIVLAALLLSREEGGCLYPFEGKSFPAAPDFLSYPAGQSRKAGFVDYLLPIIHFENRRIQVQRQRLLCLQQQSTLTSSQSRWLKQLATDY